MSRSPSARFGPALRRVPRRVAALRLALAAVAAMLVAAAPAAAAPVGCGYGSGGPYASTLCWLDMSAYDDAQASSAAGQDMSVSLPGGYTISFNVTRRAVGANATRGVTAVAFPTMPGDVIGNPLYQGTPGRPALYTNPGPGPQPTSLNNAYDDLTLRNITVTDATNTPVTGYALVGADAEVTGPDESITWTSNQPIDLVAAISPTPNSPGCQRSITGLGTTTVSCSDSGAPSSGQAGSVIVKSVGATTFTQRIFQRYSGGREAVAFAVMTAKVELQKEIVGQIAPTDSFDLSVTSPEQTPVGGVTTGGATSATTEELTVLPRAAGLEYTLGEAVTPGTGTLLGDYRQAWTCTNNGDADPSLPSGDGLTKTVSPQPGDDIVCRITNTGTPYADLAIVKTAPKSVAPNGEIAWDLTVTNRGRSASTGSTVTDELPTNVTDAATTVPGCTIADGRVTCAVGPLAVGETRTIRVTAKAPGTHSTRVVNSAKVVGNEPDPEPGNNTSTTETSTPPPVFDVSIEKTASASRATVGDEVTFRLVARNAGPDAADGVVVTDTVPSHFRVTGATASQGTCTVRGQDVRCAVGTIAAKGSATVTVTAVAERAGLARNVGVVVPPVTPPGTPPGTPTPDDPGNNTSTTTVRVVKPTLQLRKTVDRTRVRAGGRLTYRLRVVNPSRTAVKRVVTCDRLPSGLTLVRASSGFRVSQGRVCWTAARLAPGSSRTYVLTVRAAAGSAGRKVNVVTSTSPDVAKASRAQRTVRVLGAPVRAGGVAG